jgi:TP901 family phage tail tape measure protein
MAKIDKVISVKVEGVRRIKELEESLKKLRKAQRDNKKETKEDAKNYEKTAKSIRGQSKELRELRKVMSGVNNTTKKGNKLQDSMFKGVVKGAAVFSILVTAFRRVNAALTSMISTFTEFEFTMAKVRAVSGATGNEFMQLTESAEKLGRTTFFTASQVAELQLNYSKLGFTTQEILAAQEATINLSISTGSDLARAAIVAGSAIRGFQLDASEAGRVVDVMAVSFTSSAMDIEKFQTSMTKVAPIAAMAGFTIEETTAIMSKLADTGIEASIAGTSLRNILLKMQDPTSELTRKVGHTIHSLDDMLRIFKNMQDEGTDLADVLTFMDVRQVAAFGTMLEGADDIKVLVKELENSSGAGQNMADTVGDTLQGAILRVKSAIEGFSITLVKDFGKSMKETLNSFADLLNKLSDNSKLLKRVGKVLKFFTQLIIAYTIRTKFARVATALLRGGFLGMSKAIVRSTKSLTLFTTGLKGLKTAIASTGIGLLVILLGELAASFLFTNNEMGKTTDFVDKLNEKYTDTETQIEILRRSQESLITVRKQLQDLDKEDIKNTEKIKQLKKQERIEIDNLNSSLKTQGLELVNIKTATDDIVTATDDLIKKLKEKSLARIFTDLQSGIIKTEIAGETIYESLLMAWREGRLGTAGGQTQLPLGEIIDDVLKDFDGGFLGAMSDYDKARVERKDFLNNLLETYGISLADFEAVITTNFADDRIAQITKVIEDKSGKLLQDLLLPDLEKKKRTDKTGAIFGLQKFLNDAETEINNKRKAGVINEQNYQKELIKAKIQGLKDFRAQAQKEEQKDAATKQISQLELKLDAENYKLSLQALKDTFNDEKLLLDEKLANELITDEEHKQLMLIKEADYLAEKIELNKAAGKMIADELLREKEIDIENIKLRKEALRTFTGSVGEVGEAIQNLAGDEEKLQGLRKIGIKITQAAAMAEQVLALNTQLTALMKAKETKEDLKGQAVSLASIGTDLKEGISKGIVAASSFAAGVGKAFAKNPIAGLAALVAVIGIISKLRGMFKNPDLATGSTDSAGSGGSGSSGGGLGSGSTLYSFAGTGSTFANGGMVYGNSHTNGGEKFAVGGRVVELEGGEAVINKRSTAMFRSQLSAMNAAGGGVKFADGGIANSPSFAQTQFDVMGQSMMSSGGRVTVVEADITSTQNTVKTIESEASF